MEILLILTFVIGYALIALEHPVKINKTASALLAGTVLWTIYIFFQPGKEAVFEKLLHHLGGISAIVFFLLSAMTIVALVEIHDGFVVVTSRIKTLNKRILLWVIGTITFFLSSVLDNLTTTIVMITLAKKLIDNHSERLFFASVIVIAANAGGVWTPIGDVTTTMLWIGGQLTSGQMMTKLFLPSIFCLAAPLLLLTPRFKGEFVPPQRLVQDGHAISTSPFEKKLLFYCGIGGLIFVPIFKVITHLPPYMGILFVLGVLWVLTEFLHRGKGETKDNFTVPAALRRVDLPSILFFLGILMAIASLEASGLLEKFAYWMSQTIGNETIIIVALGVLSAIVDNVPLTAATMGMYPLSVFPQDHNFWMLLAYCVGTGGSMLIIGSAAGVAAMGLEKIEFIWYMVKVSFWAAIGYFAGVGIFILQTKLF